MTGYTEDLCSLWGFTAVLFNMGGKNRNGDGFIDREEFCEILRSTGEPITDEEIEELMVDGDTNKDGKIDFDGK